VIALDGIIVNNNIVFIDTYDQLRPRRRSHRGPAADRRNA
jgi:hypothetical protein